MTDDDDDMVGVHYYGLARPDDTRKRPDLEGPAMLVFDWRVGEASREVPVRRVSDVHRRVEWMKEHMPDGDAEDQLYSVLGHCAQAIEHVPWSRDPDSMTVEELEERTVKWAAVNSLSVNTMRAHVANAMLRWIRAL